MRDFQDETMDDDDGNDQSSHSSDFSSSSSWNSSSDEEFSSSSDEESDQPSVSSSRKRRRRRRQTGSSAFTGDFSFGLTSLMRNRRTHSNNSSPSANDYSYSETHKSYSSSDESYASKHKKKSIRSKRRAAKSSFHWSTILLVLSLLIYCLVQIATTDYIQSASLTSVFDEIKRDTLQQPNWDRHQKPGKTGRRPHGPVPGRKKEAVSQKEKLQPGCEVNKEWQSHDTNSRLLSCQLLHEMDLLEALSVPAAPSPKFRRERVLSPDAFLGSGLWRDVWKIKDAGASTFGSNHTNYVVLKTMKPEHEVVLRNLERHRREAAAMSQLTKSPNVADLFAYCGNSILTEFASKDMERTLRDANIHTNSKNNPRPPASDSSASLLLSSMLSANTLPIATRIDWARQASSAVADLHKVDVIHADITAKQFLMVSTSKDDRVQIKINDFNRCRFVPRRTKIINATNVTIDNSKIGDACPVRIPSAPGTYRSPEEYADKELTTQIDVYSLGNVLYEIWTNGKSAWGNRVGGKRVKDMVMAGDVPPELEMLREWDERHKGKETNDSNKEAFLLDELHREFGRIISKCYIVDPKQRITATGLVLEFTRLLERVPVQS